MGDHQCIIVAMLRWNFGDKAEKSSKKTPGKKTQTGFSGLMSIGRNQISVEIVQLYFLAAAFWVACVFKNVK